MAAEKARSRKGRCTTCDTIPTVYAVDLERHLQIVTKSYARLFDRIRHRALSVTISQDISKAGSQDHVVFGIGNISHSAAERTLVGRAILFAKAAFIIVVCVLERHRMVERQEILDECVEVIRL
ncbi:hypothetical protein HFN51_27745 [Rhizobium leguminosarum]|nr:hypothetical protein [Rhizobium leguminosarum]